MVNKSILIILTALFFVIPIVSAWTTTQIQNGTDSNKLSLIFIPSGFTEAESLIFEAEVQNNLNMLWQNNFFSDFRQRFDVYQVTDQYDSDGLLKTDTEIINLIISNDTCSLNSGTCKKIHIVIENLSSFADEVTNNFVRLRLEADNVYTLAHEISVHVLGNLGKYGGPIMKDEYIISVQCLDYTYMFINAHDKNSSEKWSDLESGDPYLGSAYCDYFYRPTENSIARGSNNQNCDAVGYRASEIGLAKRAQDGSFYDENIKPSVFVSGISAGTYSAPLDIQVNASDASGIDRVEFYMSIDGQEFRSIGIDRTLPYSHLLNLSDYSGLEYWLRIYVFDEAWNYFGGNLDGLQYGPIYYNETSSTCGPADTDIDGVVSITEIMAYITEWKAGNVDIISLMAGITEWKSGC